MTYTKTSAVSPSPSPCSLSSSAATPAERWEPSFEDPAAPAFRPLATLTDDGHANMASRAVMAWLEQDAYDHWGPGMLLAPPIRRLLQAGGLDLEAVDPYALDARHPKWHSLLRDRRLGSLHAEEALYLARTLLYLGFYAPARSLVEGVPRDTSSRRVSAWKAYVSMLIDIRTYRPGTRRPPLTGLEPAIAAGGRVAFLGELLSAAWQLHQPGGLPGCATSLDRALLRLETDHEIDESELSRGLALARLARTKLALLAATNSTDAFDAGLDEALAALESIRRPDVFEIQEAERRLLDFASIVALRWGDRARARDRAIRALALDPNDSRALLLVAESLVGECPSASASYYRDAAFKGIIERPYAWSRYGRYCRAGGDMELPIYVDVINGMADRARAGGHTPDVRHSALYPRFAPFWSLTAPSTDAPLLARVPLVAGRATEADKVPWFETLYLQRAPTITFRAELWHATMPGLSAKPPPPVVEYRAWTALAPSLCKQRMLDWLADDDPHPLERSKKARLLAALGFHDAALEFVPVPSFERRWTLEEHYQACTRLFLEHILHLGERSDRHAPIRMVFERMNDDAATLRIRLLVVILGAVACAHRGQVEELEWWRERGGPLLDRYTGLPEVSDFESQLMTGRFYRAVSFLPFLRQDHTQLRNELDVFESLARGLCPADEHQALVKADNLMAVLESASRTATALGESDRAKALMEEIVERVDPYDAKAWLQVGDLRQKDGYIREAHDAFRRAAAIGAPHARIAWFRAGRCLERLGEPREALESYLRSLECWPEGLSPAQRIWHVAHSLGDSYRVAWVERNWPAATTPSVQ
jgi:tetratricopeptide (TPR) repeat protein